MSKEKLERRIGECIKQRDRIQRNICLMKDQILLLEQRERERAENNLLRDSA